MTTAGKWSRAPGGKGFLFVTRAIRRVSGFFVRFAAATRLVAASGLRTVQRPFIFGRRMGIVQRETEQSLLRPE